MHCSLANLDAPDSVPAALPSSVPLPLDEEERLYALRAYRVLDTAPELRFDDLTRLAAMVCEVPIAAISLIDDERQWFKSRIGLDATETPRDVAFCAHAILAPDTVMVVPDATRDPRFAANPLVLGGPRIRFYAGAPLVNDEGAAVGTLCVIDRTSRTLSEPQREALAALARQAVAQLELRSALALAKVQSLTDPLTGAGNRRGFETRLTQEWDRLARAARPLSLLMLDADRFKAYNDRHGHPAGDAALRRIASAVRGELRRSDLLARWGGEEFAVLLPAADHEGAAAVAERICRSVEFACRRIGGLTVSIGVATVHPCVGDRPGGLMALADQALYRAKRAGRNRVALQF